MGHIMFVKLLCFLMLTSICVSQEQLKIGALFYEDEADDLKVALELGAEYFGFSTSVKEVSKRGEYLEITNHVCSLAQEQIIGIIDGTGGRASEHVQALCDMLELPHLMLEHNDPYSSDWSMLNIYPSVDAFNMVLQNLIIKKEWDNFTILYEKGRTITRVSELLKMGNESLIYTVSVRELSGNNYREVLTNAKENGYVNFVVDCQSRNMQRLLMHAQQVGLMADEHSYIFVSPDLFTLDLERYRYGGVNMTGFRLVQVNDSEALWYFTSEFNEKTGMAVQPEELKIKLILTYDAVKVFYDGVNKIKQNITAESLSCEDYQPWVQGSTLLNFMRTNIVEGVTRSISFTGLGQRTDVKFDILEVTPAGNQTIGTWSSNNLTIARPFMPIDDPTGESIMKNKTFKILIPTSPPYAYMKESLDILQGNDRYEGFTIDLFEKLAEYLGFYCEFEVEKDTGNYNKQTKKWNGMVLKLMEDKADFGICDFTITSERQAVIDFSTPFITTGISILYKEPSKQPPELFSFMAVFSNEVWYYMLFVQMALGVIMIFVGRISQKEWQNPVPCVEQPEELSNQFSFANSIWLIIGSVMQQGSEIAPIALAPRMITSVWWFFTMVIVASYVGTLVAFLTIQKNVMPFTSAVELADQKSIAYGAKENGATHQFFQNSTNPIYRKMGQNMKSNKWLFDDNNKGVQRAEKDNYAVFMELAAIEFYIERHCDLIQVGKLLDTKYYGIGMRKDSPYIKDIDIALLKLKETGEIQKIKNKWWKEQRGGGKCGDKGTAETKQLDMSNMKGAFVVLGVGSALGVVISILDMLWGVFKRSVKYKTTFKYELIEELKFALVFSGDVKPVKPRPGKEDGSDEALAEADREGKDELGSLRSARTMRSGRSTSTRRSLHSHSSRHSASALSVAFARRREYT